MGQENLTYDDAIARAEQLIKQLEQAPALSMDEYQKIAHECKSLLEHCRDEVVKLSNELKVDVEK